MRKGQTILICVKALFLLVILDGFTDEQIFEDYPYLPVGAVEAVRLWAARNELEC